MKGTNLWVIDNRGEGRIQTWNGEQILLNELERNEDGSLKNHPVNQATGPIAQVRIHDSEHYGTKVVCFNCEFLTRQPNRMTEESGYRSEPGGLNCDIEINPATKRVTKISGSSWSCRADGNQQSALDDWDLRTLFMDSMLRFALANFNEVYA